MRQLSRGICILSAIFIVFAVNIVLSQSAFAFSGINGRIGYVGGFPSGPIESVLTDGSNPKTISSANAVSFRWSPDGTKIAYGSPTPSVNIRNYDGSGDTVLRSEDESESFPTWSPFGDKIMFTRSDSTYVLSTVNNDGTGTVDVTSSYSIAPDWSPDGTKVVFLGWNGNTEIYTMDADGTNLERLTTTDQYEWQPRWSPDGSKILFRSTSGPIYQIYTMNADGSSVSQLTDSSDHNYSPSWSPDGTKIAFTRLTGGLYDIYTMDSDGSNETAIVTDEDYVESIDWQPLTEAIDAGDGTLKIDVNAEGKGSIDITDVFSDPYDGPDPASIEVTVEPSQGTVSVDNSTGVISYTQNGFAAKGGFLSSFANLFFAPVSAASLQDTFRINVCSSSSSELCSFGIITVNLASARSTASTSLANTGQSISLVASTALLVSITGLFYLVRYRKTNKTASK